MPSSLVSCFIELVSKASKVLSSSVIDALLGSAEGDVLLKSFRPSPSSILPRRLGGMLSIGLIWRLKRFSSCLWSAKLLAPDLMNVWIGSHSHWLCFSSSPLRNTTSCRHDSTTIRSWLLFFCNSRARFSRFWVHSFFFWRHLDAATRLRSRNLERLTSSGLLGSLVLFEPRDAYFRVRFGGDWLVEPLLVDLRLRLPLPVSCGGCVSCCWSCSRS